MVSRSQTINLVLVILAVALLFHFHKQVLDLTGPWYDPVIRPSEVQAMKWVDANLASKQQFAADLFACESITALSRQICSIGGAWELADHPNERYSATEKAFTTESADEAYAELTKYGVQYVLVAERSSFYAYGWKEPKLDKFMNSTRFKTIYADDENKTYVFKVV